MTKSVLVTGCAGFIGFHLCRTLINSGFNIFGVDALTDYYDVALKNERLNILHEFENFEFEQIRIDSPKFLETYSNRDFDFIIHLAAQAGVRYSIEHPLEYFNTNLKGTFHILELSKNCNPKHLLMASTSSVYGSNIEMPFNEHLKCDTPMSFYAATKKSNEEMGHAYSHIFNIPITMFRFFTVYGPWGRPDMALYKFTEAILQNKPIDVYNAGDMQRDFTFVGDLVYCIKELLFEVPSLPDNRQDQSKIDSLSNVAPFRVVNIGNSKPQKLMDYINTLERHLGISAQKNYLPMQPGDVKATHANVDLLNQLVADRPQTSMEDGIKQFVDWYLEYHGV